MSESNFLTAHIMKLPQATRNRILESEFSCQALLSALTPLAKQYALRMTFSSEAERRIVESWPLGDRASQAKHAKAVKELLDLGIWTKVAMVSAGAGAAGSSSFTYALHASFAGKIQEILQVGISSLWSEPSSELKALLPTRGELARHAQSCWDSLLLFLSGREDMALAVSEQTSSLPTLGLSERSGSLDLEDIFTRLNLMRREQSNDGGDMDVDDDNSNNNNNPLRTTGEGFKFLLKPPADQIWTILDEFLKMQYDLRQEEGAAAVSFLLQLGFCEEGRVCRMDEFGEWETKATGALSQLGLLYPFKEEDEEEVWILPTHLSKLLSGSEGTVCGSSSLLPSAAGGALSTTAASDTTEEGIVVETNYRVYAYTSSLLKRAILELFCVQEYVMPNLFVGRLTRESCSAAFEAGIEADVIVDYLRRNAHPQALKIRTKAPVVPETIGDGIRLWEAESKRMKMEETAYYDNFESTELFEAAVEHATANGVSLWVDQKKQRMAIKLSYYGGMRSFIKTKKLELASSH